MVVKDYVSMAAFCVRKTLCAIFYPKFKPPIVSLSDRGLTFIISYEFFSVF